jgi:iron complex outermembrane recepter protein
MVPGLYVSQPNSHAWQISTRGFTGVSNNKMLVLVNGRSVYTPTFGGVYGICWICPWKTSIESK